MSSIREPSRGPAFLAFSGTPERESPEARRKRQDRMYPASSLPAMGLGLGVSLSNVPQGGNLYPISNEGCDTSSNVFAHHERVFDSTTAPKLKESEHDRHDMKRKKLGKNAKPFCLAILCAFAIGILFGLWSHEANYNGIAGVFEGLTRVISAFTYLTGVVVGHFVKSYKDGYGFGVQHT
ncbi:hypothetical protein P154DRAFT_540402 [Amniculicola lignicola CBS 123094]|uniref:Uncharacterized protein n=1 Tax=Amniculicola lignicola CBS 123094 TaxID=1392246 RepID=A0A6A5VXR1_9PLEO|nr:hypothetical protein P154DRAFT_540402 [Amniculicola lignicola CBS 123094]